MIVILKPNVSEARRDQLISWFKAQNLGVHISQGDYQTVLGLIGDTTVSYTHLRIEFALWGHTTNPSYKVDEVVDRILDLRQRRAAAPAKRSFDKKEIPMPLF